MQYAAVCLIETFQVNLFATKTAREVVWTRLFLAEFAMAAIAKQASGTDGVFAGQNYSYRRKLEGRPLILADGTVAIHYSIVALVTIAVFLNMAALDKAQNWRSLGLVTLVS